ncbi:hypothetical protein CVT26_010739 [Gymnopilus dilepis]|uniref:Uncharacterized protein n=1 Tax=Gymnopilus dilepis TaxID=231916 RepID=A0A409Y0S1_9AGAR|nr:hypothetical protein CVT26_010739 [Gymnopilus dilepis]
MAYHIMAHRSRQPIKPLPKLSHMYMYSKIDVLVLVLVHLPPPPVPLPRGSGRWSVVVVYSCCFSLLPFAIKAGGEAQEEEVGKGWRACDQESPCLRRGGVGVTVADVGMDAAGRWPFFVGVVGVFLEEGG